MELRYYQRNAINALYGYFNACSGNPLIEIPTGGGKSPVIAAFIKEVIEQFPSERFLVLAHRKELVEQDAEKLHILWPDAPMGIYSAGLKKRQLGRAITVAGIQSVYDKADSIGWIGLIIVDEAHLIPHKDDGMYRTLIDGLKKINPKLKIIGLTATPYRLDSGLLTEGDNKIFDRICYSISVSELIQGGYLSPLVSKVSQIEADLSGVTIRGKEYAPKELQAAMDKEELIRRTVDEIIRYGHDRKAWIVFCSGVEHAVHVNERLKTCGINSEVVTSETKADDRDRILREYKQGRITALCNCDVLTTGFDAPHIDLIALLRPTKSPGLYYQMVGRGLRIHPQKTDCLVRDFAGNIIEHGPVDSMTIKSKKNRDGTKETEISGAPSKVCPKCDGVCMIQARECIDCGHEFVIERELKHSDTAAEVNILSSAEEPEWHDVFYVTYKRHTKEGKPDSLKVSYSTGNIGDQNEWVCINHTGYARTNAVNWLRGRIERGEMDLGKYYELIQKITLEDIIEKRVVPKKPTAIAVRKNGRFWEIINYKFDAAPVNHFPAMDASYEMMEEQPSEPSLTAQEIINAEFAASMEGTSW